MASEDGKPPRCDYFPWVVLVNICLLTFGSYWVYDTPGAIQTQLETWFGGPEKYTKAMNLNLYSVYSYPNIVLSFLGGFIIDRWLGIRLSCLLFSTLIFCGQVLFAFGIQFKSYPVCLLGRFVFGLGGENLTVSQNAYTVRWFSGPLLALSFAIVLCCSRLGSSINFAVTPLLTHGGVPLSIWFGTATCLLSFAASLVLTGLDYYGQDRVKAEVAEEKVSLRHVTRFPLVAWLLMFTCFFFYIAILTFYTVACDIMQKTGKRYDADTAALFLAVPNMVSILAFPVVGWLVDKHGKSLYWLLAACAMELVAHLVFLGNANDWFQVHPAVVMGWLGLAYSFGASALWPMIAFIVPTAYLGTAYGTMTALQNTGMAFAPQLIGYLQEVDGVRGTALVYTVPILVFVACACSAAALTFVLLCLDDSMAEGRLNSTAAERALMPPPRLPGGPEEEADIDVEESLHLPAMMVGTVYLRKAAPRLRSDLLNRLGVQAPLLPPPIPEGDGLTPTRGSNARAIERTGSPGSMHSPMYGSVHSPLFVRSPYTYGNVSGEG